MCETQVPPAPARDQVRLSAQGGTLAIPGQAVDRVMHLVACTRKAADLVVVAQVLLGGTRAPAAAIVIIEEDGPGAIRATGIRATLVVAVGVLRWWLQIPHMFLRLSMNNLCDMKACMHHSHPRHRFSNTHLQAVCIPCHRHLSRLSSSAHPLGMVIMIFMSCRRRGAPDLVRAEVVPPTILPSNNQQQLSSISHQHRRKHRKHLLLSTPPRRLPRKVQLSFSHPQAR